MCGIGGVFGPDAGRLAPRLSRAIAHRGPDDAGTLALDGGGPVFVHRRLSIIDLSPAGHQPMSTADGRYTIIFNGEIYNYADLRDELLGRGATMRGHSDTEVILEGWARDGARFLPRLRGMYAFAIWDAARSCGTLVRDAFGIKPLYLHDADGHVLFASELRAVVATGMVPRRLDPRAIATYLAWGSVTEPGAAVAGVRTVPAGHLVEVVRCDAGFRALAPAAFAAPLVTTTTPPVCDPAEAAATVRAALLDSVAAHLVADVEVGTFLSGGVDSSALVACASLAGARGVATFTVTFDEARFDESAPAREVAARWSTRHHEIPLRSDDFLRALGPAFEAMDQPSMDGLNTYVVSDAVRERGMKVVLSGLGGDELFAGYRSFARADRLAALAAAPRRIGAMLAGTLRASSDLRVQKAAILLGERDPARAAYAASRRLFGDAAVAALTGAPARTLAWAPWIPDALTLSQRVSWLELGGYMRDTLLRDSDVFSMAHGLELRVPFVDRQVAAASMSVADATKRRGGEGKSVLIDAVRDLVPRSVWDRPKQGFTLPFESWLRTTMRADAAAVFDGARARRVGIDPAAARRVWTRFLARRGGVTWSRPWALYTLIRWAELNDLAVDGGADAAPAGVSVPNEAAPAPA